MGATDSSTLSRAIESEHGEPILIEESSGSAFAEAERAPLVVADCGPSARRPPNMLLWLGAGLVAGLALEQVWTRLRPPPPQRRRFAVAFAFDQTDPENFVQTRGAGPGAMRDPSFESWDAVDEASDQSFPASDPPGFSRPRR